MAEVWEIRKTRGGDHGEKSRKAKRQQGNLSKEQLGGDNTKLPQKGGEHQSVEPLKGETNGGNQNGIHKSVKRT